MTNPFELLLEKISEIDCKISNFQPQSAGSLPEIINTEELCRRLDISEPTAISMRKKKKIPFIKIGSLVRYNWPEVVKYLESKTPVK